MEINNCPKCRSEKVRILSFFQRYKKNDLKIECFSCGYEICGLDKSKLINEWNKEMHKCPICNIPLNESMFCIKCCSKWTKSEPGKEESNEDFMAWAIAQENIEEAEIEWSDIDSITNLPKTAPEFLDSAKKHMEDRATIYDNKEGERSMLATVKAFGEITDIDMTEEEGWLFMGVLKMVRSQQGTFKSDNYEDGCAYFGLAGEAAAKNRK